MPPYLPLIGLTKGQQVRIGHGIGSSVPTKLEGTTNPQTDRIFYAFYADLGNGTVRRDLQHHTSLGAILPVASVTSQYKSDLFASTNALVSAGSNMAVNVASFTLSSRLFGSTLNVAGGSVSLVAQSGDTYYVVYVDGNGNVGAGPGTPAPSTGPVAEVDTVAISGTPTAGTFTLSFSYNGYQYSTAAIAYNAAASAVASAVSAATSSNGGDPLPGSFSGTGGPLPASVTLTANADFEGSLSNLAANSTGLTGGTASYTQNTAGQGASRPTVGGGVLPIATVFVPSNATSSANFNIVNIAPTA